MTRPPPRRALSALVAGALALVIAGCAGATNRTTFPPIGTTPQPAGDSTAATKQQVIAALAAVGLQAVEGDRPYRPPEGPLLAAAPRSILQVPLPDDSDPAFIVIYALGSPDDAVHAAKDHVQYIGTGNGGIQFAPDTQFVLRVVGSTVLFFTWSPANSPDARTATIAQTLSAIGTEIPLRG